MTEGYIMILTPSIAAHIKISDIVYVERNKRKIRIVTDLEEYVYYEKIENIEPFLDKRFFPCLKGCYINLDKVTSMREQRITFEGEQVLYLGRENFLRTMQYYKFYLNNQ